MKIIFVRHGLTKASEQQLFCGKTNCELSVLGREQARNTAKVLKNADIDVWLCGTSNRTKQTLDVIFDELILPKDIIIYRDDICEIGFGDFENYSFDEVKIQFPAEADRYLESWQNYTFPGGDNTKEFFDYCARSVMDIIKKYIGMNICIVGHGGYIASALCALKDVGIDRLFDNKIGCGEAVEIEIIASQPEETEEENV